MIDARAPRRIRDKAPSPWEEGSASGAAGFVDHDAFQYGYCTPGQICSAVALIEEVRAALSAPTRRVPSMKRAALTDECRYLMRTLFAA